MEGARAWGCGDGGAARAEAGRHVGRPRCQMGGSAVRSAGGGGGGAGAGDGPTAAGDNRRRVVRAPLEVPRLRGGRRWYGGRGGTGSVACAGQALPSSLAVCPFCVQVAAAMAAKRWTPCLRRRVCVVGGAPARPQGLRRRGRGGTAPAGPSHFPLRGAGGGGGRDAWGRVGGTPPLLQGAQPVPSHCPPDDKCRPQRYL